MRTKSMSKQKRRGENLRIPHWCAKCYYVADSEKKNGERELRDDIIARNKGKQTRYRTGEILARR